MPGNVCYTPTQLGEVITETVAAPGVGLDFFFVVPDNYLYMVCGVSVTLSVGGGAARRMQWSFMDSDGHIIGWVRDFGTQLSTTIRAYIANRGAAQVTTTTSPKLLQLPFLLLPGGSTIASVVDNLAAPDQLSDVHIVLQRWRTLQP